MLLTALYWAIRAPLWLFGKVLRVKPADAFDDYLAERVSDVFNYVNACVGAKSAVPAAPAMIYGLFRRTLRRACRECSEIQILAHSLGTVIVDHALTHFGDRTRKLVALTKVDESPERPRLTRLYTIGTPLEKILFFWPKVVQLEKKEKEEFVWHNFRSHADVISGALRRFREGFSRGGKAVENHTTRGAGGILTAHTGYRTHPSFLSIFGPELTKCPTKVRPRARWRRLRQLRDIVETVCVGAIVLGLALLGFVLLALPVYWVLVWFLGTMENSELPPWGAQSIAVGMGVLFASVLVVFAPLTAKDAARTIHDAHWRTVADKPDGSGSDEF